MRKRPRLVMRGWGSSGRLDDACIAAKMGVRRS